MYNQTIIYNGIFLDSMGDLPAFGIQQSFYGKAELFKDSHGGLYLMSYKTLVAAFVNGELFRLWDGQSNTTTRHIKAFIQYCGLDTDSEYKRYKKAECFELRKMDGSPALCNLETGEIIEQRKTA